MKAPFKFFRLVLGVVADSVQLKWTEQPAIYFCLILSHIQLTFHSTANWLLVDNNGWSLYNSEACVTNTATTRCRSEHSSTAQQAHDGLFSLYGSQGTVHANNICFIFSPTMPRHTGVAAEIMLPHNSPLSPA